METQQSPTQDSKTPIDSKQAVKNLENTPKVKTEQPVEKTESKPADPKQPAEGTESQEQINWRKFREAREVERKQKEAAEKRAREKEEEASALKAAMEALLNKQQTVQTQPAAVIEEELTEDQRIQRKVDAALAAKEKEYQKERQEAERREFPSKLVAAYPDFNKVCTEENLDYLDYHFPEVTAGFKNTPDSFDKWANVYKAVKRFLPNTDRQKDEAKADKNMNKPQSMSVPGRTSVGDTAPEMLTDQRRKDNWARMQRVMKGGK